MTIVLRIILQNNPRNRPSGNILEKLDDKKERVSCICIVTGLLLELNQYGHNKLLIILVLL